MTNKEAIEFLKNMIDREAIGFVCPKGEGDVAIWQYHVKALQMAISALQAQTDGDCISRQAAIEETWKEPSYADPLNVLTEMRDRLRALPSVQPEIIHCRECQHHRRDSTGCYYCVRKDYGYGWGLNDFCSDAERRTDD